MKIQQFKGFYLGLILCFFLGFAQNLKAQQRVFINFNVQVLAEDFSRPNKTWPIINTAENIFVFDKGEYFISRRHPRTGYAVMANWKNQIEEYHVKTSVRMGPSETGKECIGLILMASEDGRAGLIVEINGSKDYRVKLIADGKYEYLIGDNENWERSFYLNSAEKTNLIEVKTQNGEYDLYFNDKYIQSFSVQELFYGRFGLYLGPDTKARVDYYEVYSSRRAEEFVSVDGRNYSEMVKELSTENIRLRNEIADQQELIAQYTAGGVDKKIANLESVIADMESQLRVLNAENTEMKARLEQGGRGIDTELTEFLQETLQMLIESNQRLESTNEELTAENQQLREQLQGLSLRFLAYADETEKRLAESKQDTKKLSWKERREAALEEQEAPQNTEENKPVEIPEEVKPIFVSEENLELDSEIVFEEKKPHPFPATFTIKP